jgi:hypothetical protein
LFLIWEPNILQVCLKHENEPENIKEYKEAKGGGMFGERKDRTSFPPNRKISHLHKLCPNIKKLYIRYPWVLWR